MKLLCHRSNYGMSIDFQLHDHRPGGRVAVCEPVTLTILDKGVIEPRPTFSLTPSEAQELIDRLWDCGLRPSEGSGSAGAMAAVQAHLQDMRTLVFNPRA